MDLGTSLHYQHHEAVLRQQPAVDFFEVFPENYLYTKGRERYLFDHIAERYPISLHAITIAIGSTDPLNMEFLHKLTRLAERVRAPFVSDHLGWVGVGGQNLHQVLPIPYNQQSLDNVIARVKVVQDVLGRRLFLENSSGYLAYRASTMSEAEFLTRMAVEGDCGILLDVNNAYIGGFNQEFDAADLVRALPPDRIGYMHVSGYQDCGSYLLDTHDSPVRDAVWELYRVAHEHSGGRATVLEWDGNLPPLDQLAQEMAKVRTFQRGSTEANSPARIQASSRT